jgi:23S rRNA (uracil1939-C5)-methyltransferase
MEKEALDWLCASGIPVVKYLSCNPSTQARDIKRLCDAGYKVTDISLLDFYPQTSHIETLLTCIKN